MFVPLSNVPRPYAWGSAGGISELLGLTPNGGPEAELWLGAHPGSPARIDDPSLTGGIETLDAWVADAPDVTLDGLRRLPFLLKVLSAGAPLSLQVHPTEEWARARFASENEAGIGLEDAHRNYRDPHHKPELILAVRDGFEALCGVRPPEERAAIVAELGIDSILDAQHVAHTCERLLSGRGTPAVTSIVQQVVAAAAQASESSPYAESYRWVVRLNAQYPNDPGVVIALLLNYVQLRAGEALYLPAGNLHAYLSGLGIEIMAASDNVLRGGLTEKHIDVAELLAVATVESLPIPRVQPEQHGHVYWYRGDAAEFELGWIDGDTSILMNGPAIALNLGEPVELIGDSNRLTVARGQAVFITPDERRFDVHGASAFVLAHPQSSWKDAR